MNVKGTSTSIVADTIAITCQYAPWQIWHSADDNMSLSFQQTLPSRLQIESDIDLRQIMRRITKIIHLTNTNNVKYPEVTEE